MSAKWAAMTAIGGCVAGVTASAFYGGTCSTMAPLLTPIVLAGATVVALHRIQHQLTSHEERIRQLVADAANRSFFLAKARDEAVRQLDEERRAHEDLRTEHAEVCADYNRVVQELMQSRVDWPPATTPESDADWQHPVDEYGDAI